MERLEAFMAEADDLVRTQFSDYVFAALFAHIVYCVEHLRSRKPSAIIESSTMIHSHTGRRYAARASERRHHRAWHHVYESNRSALEPINPAFFCYVCVHFGLLFEQRCRITMRRRAKTCANSCSRSLNSGHEFMFLCFKFHRRISLVVDIAMRTRSTIRATVCWFTSTNRRRRKKATHIASLNDCSFPHRSYKVNAQSFYRCSLSLREY